MMRIALFVLTNLAVLIVAYIALGILGVDSVLKENGVDMDLGNLLVLSAVFGMAGSFVSLMLSKWMALRSTRARKITEPRGEMEGWLLETVRQQAKAAGIGMPEVAIFDSQTPNAFATGAKRNNALVAVSTGLLSTMKRDEVEAVLGHEISHVANGDMITLTLIQGVVNTFVIFLSRIIGHFVDRVVFKTERGYGPAYWITSIIAQIVFGILASTVVFWFSRRREFRADIGGAKLAGAASMIGALERLKSGVGGESLPKDMAALGISATGKKTIARMFSTHPPLEERIERLKRAQY
jgi:heat shock protein HtpX